MAKKFRRNTKKDRAARKRKIRIFDTTLRDGEQTPGVAFTFDKKLDIAHALSDLGVDIIEAGFPINSEEEFRAVKTIANNVDGSIVAALARALPKDIESAIDSGVGLVHTFISTSPEHLKYQMNKTETEVYNMAVAAVEQVKDAGLPCMFSPMDATRSDIPFLSKVVKGAEKAGADIVNIPDTVGVMYPTQMRNLISKMRNKIDIDIDVHCHNDFGMAVANTLAGIEGGADQAQVAVNGLGERAGNADLEQVVMGIQVLYGYKTQIDTKKLYTTSKLVERYSGIRIMPNFPIVGDNAFAHESGIHQHAVLKHASTFEPIKPEMVGAKTRLVLGKHVGVHGIDAKLRELGIKVGKSQIRDITKKVKDLGAKGKQVVEEDLVAIAEDVLGASPTEKQKIALLGWKLSSDLGGKPRASVKLKVNGGQKEGSAQGVGPVDASLKAIRNAIGDKKIHLDEYHLDAITGGSDALADVSIRVSKGNKSALARGVHEDVVMASIIAYIKGLNRIIG